MNVNAQTTTVLHHLYRFADVGDAPLTEDVDFLKPQFLDGIHVVLRGREALGRQVEGGKVGDRFFRNQHAAGMDGTLTREVAKAFCDG